MRHFRTGRVRSCIPRATICSKIPIPIYNPRSAECHECKVLTFEFASPNSGWRAGFDFRGAFGIFLSAGRI